MRTIHPFQWLSPSMRGKFFVVALALTLFLLVSLNAINGPLTTPEAPLGILSFELAGDLDRAELVIASWSNEAQIYAALSLGLDYLYLFAYPLALGLGCILVAERLGKHSFRLFNIGAIAAWVIIGAAPLDALENYALIRILVGNAYAWWPPIAQICAIPKFIAVALALLYILIGATVGMFLVRKPEVRSAG